MAKCYKKFIPSIKKIKFETFGRNCFILIQVQLSRISKGKF